jgi:hypothetical protein
MQKRLVRPCLAVVIAFATTLLTTPMTRAAQGEIFVEFLTAGPCNWTHRNNQNMGFVCVWKEGSGGAQDHKEERCYGFRYVPDSTLGNVWSSGCKAPPAVCDETGIVRFPASDVTATTNPRKITSTQRDTMYAVAENTHAVGDFVLGWKACVDFCNKLAKAAGLNEVPIDPKQPLGPEEYIQKLKAAN